MRIAAILKEIPAIVRAILVEPGLRTAALIIAPYAGLCIGLDVASRYGDVTGQALPVQFFISQDHGFGEYLEYSCLLSVAALLFLMWRRDRSAIYLVNSVLFTYLAADDAFEFHEKFGHWVAPALAKILPDQLPMAPNYFGEPLLFLAVCVAWLVALFFALRASRTRPVVNSVILMGCVFLMAFFGIFVDAMTDWGPHTVARTDIDAFIEDGGEFGMIIVCFLLTVAMFNIEKRRNQALHSQEIAELPLAA